MTWVAGDLERFMLELINAERAGQGLPPLAPERHLAAAAAAHSAWMLRSGLFGHPGEGGNDPAARIRAAGMDLSGTWRSAENVASVTIADERIESAVAQLHANLMASPGHRVNLLDPGLRLIGIGFALGPLSYGGAPPRQSLVVTQDFMEM